MEGVDAGAVARAKAGDREAFRDLVERHSQNVFRLAYRMTGNEEDAEDVVQEAFFKAYRSLASFAGRSEFSTWLHRITANAALDLMRRHQTKAPVWEQVDSEAVVDSGRRASPEDVVRDSEISRRVRLSLTRLSPMERTAFVLRHFEGRPIPEIARTLGVRTGAARHSVFRAVAKLRRDLSPYAGAGL